VIANNIFHVTVLLLIYFCYQFVAPKISHSKTGKNEIVKTQNGMKKFSSNFSQWIADDATPPYRVPLKLSNI